MIRIFLGNVGSGKSLSCIREMVMEPDETYFSNIKTKSKGVAAIKSNHIISREMLIKKDVKIIKKNGEVTYNLSFNKEQWVEHKEKYGKFNIVLDEFHTLMSARGFSTKQNRIMGDFLALIRKICSDSTGDSTLTLISQLDNRIDVIARDMATEVRYHICLYDKICTKCGAYWTEHSELAPFQKHKKCPNCSSKMLRKSNFRLIVHYFDSMASYKDWKYIGIDSKIQTKIIEGISEYFGYYDTYQMDDLVSEE
jgi:DNA-directed RNA polymerase subunit RPC12/RpoP